MDTAANKEAQAKSIQTKSGQRISTKDNAKLETAMVCAGFHVQESQMLRWKISLGLAKEAAGARKDTS
jgi:hypothetical protein